MKNTEFDNIINELDPEVLDAISGGVMTEEGLENYRKVMESFRAHGKPKSDFIRFMEGLDSLNCDEYRNGEDFQAVINMANKEWTE